MVTKPRIILLALGLALLMSGCRITNMHDARPLKKGERSLGLGLDGAISGDILNSKQSTSNIAIGLMPMFPSLEYSWGTRRDLNHTFYLSMAEGIGYGFKVRVLGDDDDPFAMALDPAVGIHYTLDDFETYFRMPMILSVYPGERLALSASLGLVRSSAEVWGKNVNYYGNAGFLYGRKVRFGMSMGLTAAQKKVAGQVSLGFAFRFGQERSVLR